MPENKIKLTKREFINLFSKDENTSGNKTT